MLSRHERNKKWLSRFFLSLPSYFWSEKTCRTIQTFSNKRIRMEEHTYNGKVAQNDVENGNSKSTFKNKNKKGLVILSSKWSSFSVISELSKCRIANLKPSLCYSPMNRLLLLQMKSLEFHLNSCMFYANSKVLLLTYQTIPFMYHQPRLFSLSRVLYDALLCPKLKFFTFLPSLVPFPLPCSYTNPQLTL